MTQISSIYSMFKYGYTVFFKVTLSRAGVSTSFSCGQNLLMGIAREAIASGWHCFPLKRCKWKFCYIALPFLHRQRIWKFIICCYRWEYTNYLRLPPNFRK